MKGGAIYRLAGKDTGLGGTRSAIPH